jgi:hypothetical protein
MGAYINAAATTLSGVQVVEINNVVPQSTNSRVVMLSSKTIRLGLEMATEAYARSLAGRLNTAGVTAYAQYNWVEIEITAAYGYLATDLVVQPRTMPPVLYSSQMTSRTRELSGFETVCMAVGVGVVTYIAIVAVRALWNAATQPHHE